jgi:hypothetical protein
MPSDSIQVVAFRRNSAGLRRMCSGAQGFMHDAHYQLKPTLALPSPSPDDTATPRPKSKLPDWCE